MSRAVGQEPASKTPSRAIIKGLEAYFFSNGYVRRVNLDRRQAEKQGYKKGYEVRLVAATPEELAELRGLLETAGFSLSRPFAKAKQYVQPIYGRKEVIRFLALMGESLESLPPSPH